MADWVFKVFCLFTLVCASGVVLARNPVHSAFSLVLSLFGLAILYLQWGAPFIAMIQILVYAGAIVVLMVFVIMLLNLSRKKQSFHSTLTIVMAGFGGWLLALGLLRLLKRGTFAGNFPVSEVNTRVLSKMLFSQYLWPFEILSFFLLVMVFGIFILTRPEKGDLQ